MQKKFNTVLLLLLILLSAILNYKAVSVLAAENDVLAKQLSGRILLQVESHGEAWYINPSDLKRYYLGRPDDAFDLMRKFGIGITNKDLEKISVAVIDNKNLDDDNDGLSNALENSLGTDTQKMDSDNDGHNDKTEIESGYNPLGTGKFNIDPTFTKKNEGKIFLQVEAKGEAWYVNPADQKRYFLSRPQDAFDVMKKLGLGITNENLNLITIESLTPTTTPENAEAFYEAAAAIRSGDVNKSLAYFTSDMQSVMQYSLNFLNSEGKFNLGNILAGATLLSSTNNEKIYSTTVYVSGYTKTLYFHVKKQTDGKWLMNNL